MRFLIAYIYLFWGSICAQIPGIVVLNPEVISTDIVGVDQAAADPVAFSRALASDLSRLFLQQKDFQVKDLGLLEQGFALLPPASSKVGFLEFARSQNVRYAVRARLLAFRVERNERNVPYTKRTLIQDSVYLELGLELLDLRENSVTRSTHFELDGKTTLSEPTETLLSRLRRKCAAQLLCEVALAIHPVLIISAEKDQLHLNRGLGGFFEIGDSWSLFVPGEELIDPVNRRRLGQIEKQIGTIRIIEVHQDYTRAQLINLAPGAQPVGAFCRPSLTHQHHPSP